MQHWERWDTRGILHKIREIFDTTGGGRGVGRIHLRKTKRESNTGAEKLREADLIFVVANSARGGTGQIATQGHHAPIEKIPRPARRKIRELGGGRSLYRCKDDGHSHWGPVIGDSPAERRAPKGQDTCFSRGGKKKKNTKQKNTHRGQEVGGNQPGKRLNKRDG